MKSAKPQTKTEIRQRLTAAGIRPKRLRGQNFLIDPNAMQAVVDAAELTPDDFAFEVGAGTAGLTAMLADRAGEVLAVEVDPALCAVARDVLADRPNVTLLETDVLAGKHEIDPRVRETLREKSSRHARTVLAANLPYSIATPLVMNLLLGEIRFERMVFTVQREVAERMIACPGTREYGWVSVIVAVSCKGEILRKLGPHAFWPVPKVASSLVRLLPRRDWRQRIDLDALRSVGPYIFQQRRKTVSRILRNYLERAADVASGADRNACPRDAEVLLEAAGIPPKTRGDRLTPEQIIRLSEAIGRENA